MAEVSTVSPTPKKVKVKNMKTGANVRDFLDGDIPTGREMGEKEMLDWIKDKRAVSVSIEVKGKFAGAELSSMFTSFPLRFDEDGNNLERNAETIKERLNKFISMVEGLMERWNEEMG